MDALLPGFFQEAVKCLHSFQVSVHMLEAALAWVILFQTKGDILYSESKTETMTSDCLLQNTHCYPLFTIGKAIFSLYRENPFWSWAEETDNW